MQQVHIIDDKELNIVMEFNRKYIHFTFPTKIKILEFNYFLKLNYFLKKN